MNGSPMKPWEANFTPQPNRMQNSSSNMQYVIAGNSGRNRMVPTLPPRPSSSGPGGTQYNMGYDSNSYGINRPYGYTPYPSYGSYGGMMGGYGGMVGGYGGMYGNHFGAAAESRFIQLAEESTRPAFQSIESLVRAFGSISMMMDSTFFAITSSFRAVLGIAENFGRLRTMFGQFWSSFAIFRALNWMYKKLLSMLGFDISTAVGNKAWNQAVLGAVPETVPNRASWPIFVFLGIIVSAPYLISKIIPPVIDRSNVNEWPSQGHNAKVLYEFTASNPQELSVTQGETIRIAPKMIQDEMRLKNTGWVFVASEIGSGMVPLCYLHMIKKSVNPEEATGEAVQSHPGQEERTVDGI